MELPQLHHPWLVAVWPGMGHVAANAGVYLLAKLGMNALAEFDAPELFDIEQVEVKEGIIQRPRRPRHRFFYWQNPQHHHDLVVCLGEAQPQFGKFAFCRQIIEIAKKLQVERVFTFAAMATQMQPQDRSRVFGAVTDSKYLDELKQLELEIVQEGHIGGLNGVLLAAAAAAELPGTCLLGEMPHIFAQFPFPKASLAILEVFSTIARIDLDLQDLQAEAERVEEQLEELLKRIQQQFEYPSSEEEHKLEAEGTEPEGTEPAEEEPVAERSDTGDQARGPTRHRKPGRNGQLSASDREQIERLFSEAAADRSKAFELKQVLDRLGVFKEYEDRFLDLFKKPSA